MAGPPSLSRPAGALALSLWRNRRETSDCGSATGPQSANRACAYRKVLVAASPLALA
jgi:hypothetical protein